MGTAVNNENIPDYGDGSFRITLGDFVSPCIPFAVKVEDLKTMLEDASHKKLLHNVLSVHVEEHIRWEKAIASSSAVYRELHVYFEGVGQDLEWPIIRID